MTLPCYRVAMRPRPTALTPGMRFIPRSSTIGTKTVGAWEVIELFQGTDGVAYARVANVSDGIRIKSMACEALLNERLYRRVE
jgi:hypothetical protein